MLVYVMNAKSEKYFDSQCGKLSEELKKAYLAGQNIVYIVTKDYAIVKEAISSEPLFFLNAKPTTKDGDTQQNCGVTTTELRTVVEQNLFFGEEELKHFDPKVPSICIVTIKSGAGDNLPNYLNEYLKLFVDNLTDLSAKSGNKKFKQSMVLVVTPNMVDIPAEIALYCRIVRVEDPSEREVQEKIVTLVKEFDRRDLSNEAGQSTYIRQLTNLTKGLSLNKISQIFSRIKSELDFVYVPTSNKEQFVEIEKIILDEKSQMIENSAILKLIKSSKSNHIASGMKRLGAWLNERRRIILNPNESMADAFIPQPKGILLAGIPGTGKSLAAKTTASEFGNLPLLQLDMGNIMDKYQGESEHKMEEALKLAEAMSPCVLWIDEIEKGIAGASSSSGNSESMKRIFGKLLTWMQEKEDRGICCFVFATANSIDSIPPELFRSGRFDEKFYTFFPSSKECIEIFLGILRSQDKAYRRYCERKGTPVRPLFDGNILQEKFWMRILNSAYVLPNRMTANSTKVSKENKFMTGSDIEAIVERAKLILYNKVGALSKSSSCVYQTEDFRRALYQAIADIRTYAQTNARQVAECFVQLSEYNFHAVSEQVTVPFEYFDFTIDEEEEPFDLKSEKAEKYMNDLPSEYDRQLFLYIGLAVNQYMSKSKKQKRA